MYTRSRIWIKQHFPTLYRALRTRFLPYAGVRRVAKARQFNKPQFYKISYLGAKFEILLDPTNGFVDRTIFTTGLYEPDILAVMAKHLAPGAVFIDIGANIGQHSLFAACLVGNTGQVIAFDPLPKLVAQLNQSIERNHFSDRFVLHNVGCADKSGQASLTTLPTNIGGSSLHRANSKDSGLVEIKLERADHYLDKLSRIDLIKIDTEGHEYEVLLGLTDTLAKHKPAIILEFSPSFRADLPKEAILELLNQFDYRYFDLEDGHCEIVKQAEWLANFKKTQTNLLCLSDSKKK